MTETNITFRDKIKRTILVKNKIKSMIIETVGTPENVLTLSKNFIIVDSSFTNFQLINKEMRVFSKDFSAAQSIIFTSKDSPYKILSGREAYGYEKANRHFKVGYYLPAIEMLNSIIGQAEQELGEVIRITQSIPDEHLIKLEEILFGDE